MPSHLSAIGFVVRNDDEVAELAQRLGPKASAFATPEGTYWQWSADCGAQLWLQITAARELVGVIPYFAGKSELLVRLERRIPEAGGLDGGFVATALQVDPKTQAVSDAYPLVFDAPDFARYAQLPLPCELPVRIAAFAHDIELHDSLAEFEKRGRVPDSASHSDPGAHPPLADQAFMATGLFNASAAPPTADALLSGHIRAASELVNPQSGARFWWVLVDSLAGSFDVVIDPELCGDRQPLAGGVLAGTFWLCGRLLAPRPAPVAPKRSWLARLFRRTS